MLTNLLQVLVSGIARVDDVVAELEGAEGSVIILVSALIHFDRLFVCVVHCESGVEVGDMLHLGDELTNEFRIMGLELHGRLELGVVYGFEDALGIGK